MSIYFEISNKRMNKEGTDKRFISAFLPLFLLAAYFLFNKIALHDSTIFLKQTLTQS